MTIESANSTLYSSSDLYQRVQESYHTRAIHEELIARQENLDDLVQLVEVIFVINSRHPLNQFNCNLQLNETPSAVVTQFISIDLYIPLDKQDIQVFEGLKMDSECVTKFKKTIDDVAGQASCEVCGLVGYMKVSGLTPHMVSLLRDRLSGYQKIHSDQLISPDESVRAKINRERLLGCTCRMNHLTHILPKITTATPTTSGDHDHQCIPADTADFKSREVVLSAMFERRRETKSAGIFLLQERLYRRDSYTHQALVDHSAAPSSGSPDQTDLARVDPPVPTQTADTEDAHSEAVTLLIDFFSDALVPIDSPCDNALEVKIRTDSATAHELTVEDARNKENLPKLANNPHSDPINKEQTFSSAPHPLKSQEGPEAIILAACSSQPGDTNHREFFSGKIENWKPKRRTRNQILRTEITDESFRTPRKRRTYQPYRQIRRHDSDKPPADTDALIQEDLLLKDYIIGNPNCSACFYTKKGRVCHVCLNEFPVKKGKRVEFFIHDGIDKSVCKRTDEVIDECRNFSGQEIVSDDKEIINLQEVVDWFMLEDICHILLAEATIVMTAVESAVEPGIEPVVQPALELAVEPGEQEEEEQEAASKDDNAPSAGPSRWAKRRRNKKLKKLQLLMDSQSEDPPPIDNSVGCCMQDRESFEMGE